MVTIGKYHFTVVEESRAPKKYDRLFDSSERFEGVNLFDVYGHFSQRKLAVWNEWNDYCSENCFGSFWICSHNTSWFTIAFDLEYMGCTCRAYITPSYNYLLIPA